MPGPLFDRRPRDPFGPLNATLPTEVYVDSAAGNNNNPGTQALPFASRQRGIDALFPPLFPPRVLAADVFLYDESPASTINEQVTIPAFISPDRPASGSEFFFRIVGTEAVLHASVTQTGASVPVSDAPSLEDVNVVGTPFTASALARDAFLRPQDVLATADRDQFPIFDNTTSQVTVARGFTTFLVDTAVFDVVQPRIIWKTNDAETPITMLGSGTVIVSGYDFEGPAAASEFSASLATFDGNGEIIFSRCKVREHSALWKGRAGQTARLGGVLIVADTFNPGGVSFDKVQTRLTGAIYTSSAQKMFVNRMKDPPFIEGVYVEGGLGFDDQTTVSLTSIDVRSGGITVNDTTIFFASDVQIEGAGASPALALERSYGFLISIAGSSGNTDVGVQVGKLASADVSAGNTVTGSAGDVRVGARPVPVPWSVLDLGRVTDFAEHDGSSGAAIGLSGGTAAALPTTVFLNRSTGDDANDGLTSGTAKLTDAGVFAALFPAGAPQRNLAVEGTDLTVNDVSPGGSYALVTTPIPSFVPGDFALRIIGTETVLHSGVVQTGAVVTTAGFFAQREITFVGTPFTPSALDDAAFVYSQDTGIGDGSRAAPIISNTDAVLTVTHRNTTAFVDTATFNVVAPAITLTLTVGQLGYQSAGSGRVIWEGYRIEGPAAASTTAGALAATLGDCIFELHRVEVEDLRRLFKRGNVRGARNVLGAMLTRTDTNTNFAVASAPFNSLALRHLGPRAVQIENIVAGELLSEFAGFSVSVPNAGPAISNCASTVRLRRCDIRGASKIGFSNDQDAQLREVSVEGASGVPAIDATNTVFGQIRDVSGSVGNTDVGLELGRNCHAVISFGSGRTITGTLGDVRVGAKTAIQSWAACEDGRSDFDDGDRSLGVTIGDEDLPSLRVPEDPTFRDLGDFAVTDHYCSAAGDDATGDGSLANPWRQPQRRIDELPKNATSYPLFATVNIHLVGAGPFEPPRVDLGTSPGVTINIIGDTQASAAETFSITASTGVQPANPSAPAAETKKAMWDVPVGAYGTSITATSHWLEKVATPNTIPVLDASTSPNVRLIGASDPSGSFNGTVNLRPFTSIIEGPFGLTRIWSAKPDVHFVRFAGCVFNTGSGTVTVQKVAIAGCHVDSGSVVLIEPRDCSFTASPTFDVDMFMGFSQNVEVNCLMVGGRSLSLDSGFIRRLSGVIRRTALSSEPMVRCSGSSADGSLGTGGIAEIKNLDLEGVATGTNDGILIDGIKARLKDVSVDGDMNTFLRVRRGGNIEITGEVNGESQDVCVEIENQSTVTGLANCDGTLINGTSAGDEVVVGGNAVTAFSSAPTTDVGLGNTSQLCRGGA